MTAKLDKNHEMYKLLNEKERVNHDIMSTFGRFGLSHMTYIALALDKRLNDYETMGALFEQRRADLMALTLWQRLLAIIKHLLEVLADMLGVNYEELSASIVRSEKMLEKYIVMAEALEELEEAA